MATLSLRSIASSCLGVSGTFTVDSHVFGYPFRDTDGSVFGTLAGTDTFPATGEATTRSLKQHLETISGTSCDIVAILVGHENDFSGAVDRDDVTKAQYAIQVMRDIYAQRDLGVRRINWQRIPMADVGGYVDITDSAEAEDLTDDWNGPDGGIDVFFVQTIGDAGGWSNVDGPCDKDSKDGRTGAVLEFVGGRRFTGVLLAHEVGHYLKLEHGNDITNLMGADTNNDGIGEITRNSTGLTAAQGDLMKTKDCYIDESC